MRAGPQCARHQNQVVGAGLADRIDGGLRCAGPFAGRNIVGLIHQPEHHRIVAFERQREATPDIGKRGHRYFRAADLVAVILGVVMEIDHQIHAGRLGACHRLLQQR